MKIVYSREEIFLKILFLHLEILRIEIIDMMLIIYIGCCYLRIGFLLLRFCENSDCRLTLGGNRRQMFQVSFPVFGHHLLHKDVKACDVFIHNDVLKQFNGEK